MSGAHCSQFENHIRAIAGLPLGNTHPTHTHNAMINIIGQFNNTNLALKQPYAHLHLYDKTERINRKIGHININTHSQILLDEALINLAGYLPKRDSK
jgi:5-(carboxyamino)imidazole ribonucleotide synthase